MTICYKFASRSRPLRFFECLDNIKNNSASDDYFICATLDTDDDTMNNVHTLEKILEYDNLLVFWGTSTGKINAINRDLATIYENHPFDILCNHSDDMFFTKEGYDKDIREAFKGFSGLVHFPDQYAGDRLCTYTMYSSDYFERFGYIYHPDYISVYADNEQTDVAKALGQYKFVDKQILLHKHPIGGGGEWDAQYEKTENQSNYAKDRDTFMRRKHNNFDL